MPRSFSYSKFMNPILARITTSSPFRVSTNNIVLQHLFYVSNALGTDSILQRIASLVVREEVWMYKIKLPCWEIYSHVVFFILLLAMRLTKSRFVSPKFDLLVIAINFFIPKIYLLIFRIRCISLPIKSYA